MSARARHDKCRVPVVRQQRAISRTWVRAVCHHLYPALCHGNDKCLISMIALSYPFEFIELEQLVITQLAYDAEDCSSADRDDVRFTRSVSRSLMPAKLK